MVVKDELTRIFLDKLTQNVISCLPVIENISNAQHEKIKEVGVNNSGDFFLGALWCIILEKFLVTSYLHTRKTIGYEQSLEISEYILEKISYHI
jgi:hypothetical protein